MEKELMQYLELLTKQYQIDDQHQTLERINRVNDEIERLLGIAEQKQQQDNPHLQDAIQYAKASYLFVQKESPLAYGIMFQESDQPTSEFHWFTSKERRDQAIMELLEKGQVSLESHISLARRTIKPYAFGPIDLPKTFFSWGLN